jgi:signal peptidase I
MAQAGTSDGAERRGILGLLRAKLAVACLPVVTSVSLAACGGSGGKIVGHVTNVSSAMEPTLHVGQHLAVIALSGPPAIGEIVLLHPPSGAAKGAAVCGNPDEGAGHQQACSQPTPKEETSIQFVKRVVAGPGDRISIRDGHVIRNGVRERDAYITPCGGGATCSFPSTIVVPADDYFVLGDNRGESDDSRFWGPVPASWIIGTVR